MVCVYMCAIFNSVRTYVCVCACVNIFMSPSITKSSFLVFYSPNPKDSELFSKEQSSAQPLSDLGQKFSFMKAPSNRSTNFLSSFYPISTPVGPGSRLKMCV